MIMAYGVLTPNESSTASITVVIECGRKPDIEFVGGADFMLAPSVNSALNADIDIASNKISNNARLTTAKASGGDHSVTKAITVSPW